MLDIHAAETAFAAILTEGRVVTWGDPINGGDSSRVQEQLKDVQARSSDRLLVVVVVVSMVV